MPAGRPSIYQPSMCSQVIDLGREGASKAEMAANIGINRDTFAEWEKTNHEFSEAVKEAVQLSQAWWEEQGRKATFGGVEGFNATAWIFNMKNRFRDDWRDKVEQEQTLKGEMVHKVERAVVRPKNTDG